MKLLPAALLASVLALVACEQKTTAPAQDASAAASTTAPAPTTPAAEPASAATAAAAPENELGKKSFNKTCSMCHPAGVGGAPKPGDKADWAPRIAQGMDVLYKHAIEGFTGAKGMMPARGGSTMTDEEVKAAVDYMVDKSR